MVVSFVSPAHPWGLSRNRREIVGKGLPWHMRDISPRMAQRFADRLELEVEMTQTVTT